MTRAVGRGLVGLGLLMTFVWMFLPLYGHSGGPSLWQVLSRFDVVMLLFLLAGGALVVASFLVASTELPDGLLTMIAGGMAAVVLFVGLEFQWTEALSVVLSCLIGLALLAGCILLALPAPIAERLTEAMGRATDRAVARRAAAVQVRGGERTATAWTTTPAGWYPDPSGQFGTRFWDGQAWTESVR
jgi:hypothetical protein